MPRPLATMAKSELSRVVAETVAHYDDHAQAFWEGTKAHDVSQNVEAFLRHSDRPGPLTILDLGCGPGRDLETFRALGHQAVGLDASEAFVEMARAHAGCEVWRQDLLALELPEARFDGVFANAVLFHVPTQELPRVLGDIFQTLRPGGVLFVSNPRGPDVEGFQGDRYGSFLSLPTWRAYASDAGFIELEHYFRPAGQPLERQPWLATVWRRPA